MAGGWRRNKESLKVPECDQIPEFEEFDNALDDREPQKRWFLLKCYL